MLQQETESNQAARYIERVRQFNISDDAKRSLAGLEKALPPNELLAVSVWLSTFYRFQLEWLLDFGRFSLVCKSRQIGASHTIAAAVTLWGILGESTTVISIGEREAAEVIEKSRCHALALARLGSAWAAPEAKVGSVSFQSGGSVTALPTSSGGRSYTGNVFLDEIGYYERHDPEKVWDAASGSTMHGYRMRVASTPNGVGNLWHQLWHDPTANKGYRKHEVTIDEAIADGMRVDLDECWKMARGDSRVFDQLFRCKFLDNDSQYIPSDFLAIAERKFLELPLPEREGVTDLERCWKTGLVFYAGIDIGLSRDRTVLVVIAVNPKTRDWWLVHVESHKRTDQQLLEELTRKAFVTYRCKRLCADATGLGSIPSQGLAKKWPQKFEPVPFTSAVKEDLATGLYESMSKGLAHMPKTYDHNGQREGALLRDDICAIRRLVTKSGNVRYDAPATKSGHADRAWALMLAHHAENRPQTGFGMGEERLF